MITYRFLSEKPSIQHIIEGNRPWEVIKTEIEEKIGYYVDPKGFDNKQQDEMTKPEIVAYFQHESDNNEYRTLTLSELVPESYSLVVQRLPKRITTRIPDASTWNANAPAPAPAPAPTVELTTASNNELNNETNRYDNNETNRYEIEIKIEIEID